MAVRICTAGVPNFMHGGLEVGPGWSEVLRPTASQRAALRDYHGRFIQVHPADRDKLGELGLEFKDESAPLVETKPVEKSDTTKKSDTKHDARKGDEKRG